MTYKSSCSSDCLRIKYHFLRGSGQPTQNLCIKRKPSAKHEVRGQSKMREEHPLLYLCPLLVSWIFPEYSGVWFEFTDSANNPNEEFPTKHFNFVGNDISYDSCSWEVKVSEMANRIPSTITEIYCKNHGSACDQSSFFEVSSV